ncbi:MAG: DUF4870 domain-containing protein [Defluviitaleaceae bacterium]|nr:DUF4870 domain-containing protein [Defluviitaleaceae bacterium]MCL2263839.1 DUF4870 domain-containing protein [Defluviitaleaceae bacterium]
MKSIFGLDENIVASLSYLFGPISGILVLVLEKENKFVRFHAMQSTIWFLLLMILGWVIGAIGNIFGMVPLIGWIFGAGIGIIVALLGLISLLSMIFLMIKAFTGATTKIPVIGEVAWKQVNK